MTSITHFDTGVLSIFGQVPCPANFKGADFSYSLILLHFCSHCLSMLYNNMFFSGAIAQPSPLVGNTISVACSERGSITIPFKTSSHVNQLNWKSLNWVPLRTFKHLYIATDSKSSVNYDIVDNAQTHDPVVEPSGNIDDSKCFQCKHTIGM